MVACDPGSLDGCDLPRAERESKRRKEELKAKLHAAQVGQQGAACVVCSAYCMGQCGVLVWGTDQCLFFGVNRYRHEGARKCGVRTPVWRMGSVRYPTCTYAMQRRTCSAFLSVGCTPSACAMHRPSASHSCRNVSVSDRSGPCAVYLVCAPRLLT